ncbi:hypothetical protein NMD63_05615 [Edwardsiella tarda]|uniref:hypothetical protein n=1 Tax=Edwardsiella tarda TaxID=636 RepID=UPI00351C680A
MKDCWVVWLNRGLMVLTALLMLSAIITLITVIVSYNGGKMDLGSAADWFSGLCNAVMAGAAVYAAYNAKDWLNSKKSDNAFNIAVKLTDTIKEIYFLITNAIFEVKPKNLCDMQNDEIKIYKEKYQQLQLTLTEKLRELYLLEAKLNFFGARLKNDDIFNLIKMSFSKYISYINLIISLIDKDDIKEASLFDEKLNDILNTIHSNRKDFYAEIDKLFEL